MPAELGLASGVGAVQLLEMWPLAQHRLQTSEVLAVLFLQLALVRNTLEGEDGAVDKSLNAFSTELKLSKGLGTSRMRAAAEGSLKVLR